MDQLPSVITLRLSGVTPLVQAIATSVDIANKQLCLIDALHSVLHIEDVSEILNNLLLLQVKHTTCGQVSIHILRTLDPATMIKLIVRVES